MTAPELKPCPFCGAEAERIDIGNDECGNAGGSVIQCAKCMASSRVEFGFKENLIDAWNPRADLAAVQPAPAPNAGAVKVKPLVWRETGTDRYSAKNEDYKVVTDGGGWAFCPEDWPPFAGYPYATMELAQAAAQADYDARIMSAIETTPDPRDDVIARLVEALGETLDAIEGYNRTLPDEDGLYWDRSDLITQEIMSARAALAAAKEVHDA